MSFDYFQKFQEKENLLKSSSKCELSIDHHIYNKITCKESHVLQPFSNQNAGATTTVQQTLTLLSEVNATIEEQNEITRRTSLIFDHIPTPKPTHGELKTSRDFIKKLCKQSTDDVQIEFSDLFTKFIQTLRILSYPALSVLYEHAGTTCPTGKYVYFSNNNEDQVQLCFHINLMSTRYFFRNFNFVFILKYLILENICWMLYQV